MHQRSTQADLGKVNIHPGMIFYVSVLLLCLFETARLWTIAPDQMAAHFNAQGLPDRFAPRAEVFGSQVQTLLVVVLVSLGIQLLFFMIPPGLLNLPHRDYWLAPERRAETLGRLRSFGALVFGVILLAVQAAFEIAAYASLQTPVVFHAEWMAAVMLVAAGSIVWMLVRLVRSFRRPASLPGPAL